ncbi:hypothetical protein NPIL_330001 [Nephila pilipes]|uniref:Uncharacterized protein n=1 Tax=Nephila pilipes TaxID=299642 RepID=A0A8X6TES1_NEPPI|nr:hypothetical protein NPIL_330001 [Nephila pilipes]
MNLTQIFFSGATILLDPLSEGHVMFGQSIGIAECQQKKRMHVIICPARDVRQSIHQIDTITVPGIPLGGNQSMDVQRQIIRMEN